MPNLASTQIAASFDVVIVPQASCSQKHNAAVLHIDICSPLPDGVPFKLLLSGKDGMTLTCSKSALGQSKRETALVTVVEHGSLFHVKDANMPLLLAPHKHYQVQNATSATALE